MNSSHLPAGRGAHGGPAMGGMSGHPGGGGGGSGGGGGNAGRGGGSRRGRHYNSGNYHYNNNYNGNGRHNHGQHNNGHYGQYQNQAYQGYANGFPVPANSYAPMPYMQGNGMANNFVPYQQGYGRGAPANNQFAPMGPVPLGMHGAPPLQPFVPHQQQPPQQFQPHASLPLSQPQLPQHMQHPQQPHTNAFPRNTPQAPLIVSTAQHHQMQMPPAGRYPAVPPPANAGFPPYPHAPLGANGLPLSLPPHIPPPTHIDYEPEYANGVPAVPHPVMIPPEFHPAKSSSTASPDAIATPASGLSNQPLETPTITAVEAISVAPFVAESDVSVVPTFGEFVVDESDPSLAIAKQPIKGIWTSHPNEAFPSKRKARRSKKRDLGGVTNVDMPQGPADSAVTPQTPKATQATLSSQAASSQAVSSQEAAAPAAPTAPAPSNCSTSSNSIAPPPALPVIPALPIRTAPAANASAASTGLAKADEKTPAVKAPADAPAKDAKKDGLPAKQASTDEANDSSPNGDPKEPKESRESRESREPKEAAPVVAAAPTSWANLFAKKASAAPAAQPGPNGSAAVNGFATNGSNGAAPFPKPNTNSVAEAISTYRVRNSGQVAFIEPRGLYNSGNMCYMHAVLQALTFCTPFYDFLDQVGQKAAYSFKSETPMLDAMISYVREFKVIDRAEPSELRRRLKNADFDRHGDPFTPEFVYRATREVPRFSSMVHGHQQDAEEFLGFLLESVNDECTKVVQSNSSDPATPASGTPSGSVTSETPDAAGDGWLEVGPRQKTAVMQSSGHVSASPVNSIFLSQLRSELNVPGRHVSVTVEPYQTLQLHIDSPEVHNIVDALRGLTVPEVVRLESPKGGEVTASKRLFIQTLPPVLILHLKRFQFDSSLGSVKKISKKVGYPLELDIPRELLSHGSKRGTLQSEPLPKYRLNAVVYHHGKQASGGHYTVDVLRSDGVEWIRLDDTSIRRITKVDVAEAGAEDPAPSKANTAATNGKRETVPATNGSANRFAGIDGEDATQSGSGWSAPVNSNGKKWSAVASSTTANAAPPKPKPAEDSIKDNKVAYLLFYQRTN